MKPQFKNKQSKWNTIPDYLIKLLKEMIEENPQACKTDEIPQGFGQFGLESTNPIPINSILDNEIYLSRLRLENGNKITWQRGGSLITDNIVSLIDCYIIFDNKGEIVTTLYFSPYHFKTSNKAPKGFKLI